MSAKIGLLIIPLVALVLILGCVTGPTGVAGGPGVVIQEFTSDFPTVESGEQVRLALKVQNQGDVKAENVKAEIAGIDLDNWMGFGFGAGEQDLGDILPRDTETNTPGGTKNAYWDLEAPDYAQGVTQSHTAIVKVSYDYKTSAQKPITLVDEDELRRIKQQGRTLPSKATTYTSGPISIEVQTGDYVKTTDTGFGSYDIFPIYVKIRNTQWTQGGTVIGEGYGFGFTGEANYPVELTITPPDGTNFVYSGYGGSSDCGTGVVVDLWQGDEYDVVCELEVTQPPAYQVDKILTVEAQYRFQTEASTPLTVIGTGEGGFF